MSKPTISLPEHNTANRGGKFNALDGVSAQDLEDGDLTNKIEVVENNVNTSKPGLYTVKYRVTDSHGNTYEVVRNIEVVTPKFLYHPYVWLLIMTSIWCTTMSIFSRWNKNNN